MEPCDRDALVSDGAVSGRGVRGRREACNQEATEGEPPRFPSPPPCSPAPSSSWPRTPCPPTPGRPKLGPFVALPPASAWSFRLDPPWPVRVGPGGGSLSERRLDYFPSGGSDASAENEPFRRPWLTGKPLELGSLRCVQLDLRCAPHARRLPKPHTESGYDKLMELRRPTRTSHRPGLFHRPGVSRLATSGRWRKW